MTTDDEGDLAAHFRVAMVGATKSVRAGEVAEALLVVTDPRTLMALVAWFVTHDPLAWSRAALAMVYFHLPAAAAADSPGRDAAAAASWLQVAKGHGDAIDALDATAWAVYSTNSQSAQDASIALGDLVLAAGDPEHPSRVYWLDGQATRIGQRFSTGGRQVTDLDTAVDLAKEAYDRTPDDHPDKASRATNYAIALRDRYEAGGRPVTDLDTAVDLDKEAYDRTPDDHPDKAGRATKYANRLWDRYESGGRPVTDLDTAVDLDKEAYARTPDDHPDKAGRATKYANRLWNRYKSGGRPVTDLDDAVDLAKEAYDRMAEDDPGRAESANMCSIVLSERYAAGGRPVTDLDTALALAKEAYDRTPVTAHLATNYAVALCDRFKAGGRSVTDLDDAVTLAKEAYEVTPDDHPDKAGWAGNYAIALGDRFYEGVRPVTDLDTAVDLAKEAYDRTPDKHPKRARMATTLSNRLSERFATGNGSVTDLKSAVALAKEAYDRTPVDHPERALSASNYGAMLWQAGGGTAAVGVWRESLGPTRAAAASVSRVSGLLSWVEAVAGDGVWWPSGVEALVGLVGCAEEAVAARDDRAGVWGVWCAAVLAQLGAAVAGSAEGRVPHADGQFDAEWLIGVCDRLDPAGAGLPIQTRTARAGLAACEATRGVWLGRAVQSRRTELGQLRALDPDLAQEYLTVTDQLVRWDLTSDRSSAGLGLLDPTAGPVGLGRRGPDPAQRAALQQHRDSLLDRIRVLPGLDRFALPPLVDQLLAAVPDDGMVLVPVAAPHDGDHAWMLVLLPGRVDAVALPTVTWHVLQQVAALWQDSGSHDHFAERTRVQLRILTWLWHHLTNPVEAHLHTAGIDHVERVWWVATAALATLPIGIRPPDTDPTGTTPPPATHRGGAVLRSATTSTLLPAGDLLHQADLVLGPDIPWDPTPDSVLAGAVASRTPTVVLLTTPPPEADPDPHTTGTITTIGVNSYDNDTLPDLPFAVPEATAVAALYTPQTPPLAGDAVTADQVLAALPDHPTTHFACHGTTDPHDPTHSRLELHHDAVTIAAIADLPGFNAHLAVLSACNTNHPSNDEHLTLATAMHIAGYHHTIAATNPVPDDLTPAFMTHLHHQLHTGTPPAQALHNTQHWAQHHLHDPAAWTHWIHTGP